MTKSERIQKNIREQLKSPNLIKFDRYWLSLSYLTRDEQQRVIKQHKKLSEYIRLRNLDFYITRRQLRKALSAFSYVPAGSTGGALQVEDLSTVLKMVTFNDKHLKLWKAADG